MMQADNNILLISGATPEAGKTFVSCNLAAVIAQSDKKVLLIDADLRKGQVHHVIGCSEKDGLSDVLIGSKILLEVVKKTEIKNLDFISRGKIPPNPSELLMNANFKHLMVWAGSQYDIVIIDTPLGLAKIILRAIFYRWCVKNKQPFGLDIKHYPLTFLDNAALNIK